MKAHRIKIDHATFERLISRAQTGLVCREASSWGVGDTVWLSSPSGAAMMRTVTHIIDGTPGLVAGWAAASFY